MTKKLAVMYEIHDKEGNLTKIEACEADGTHIFDILWDPTDEQTSTNRIEFRKWARLMLERKGFDIAE